MFNLSRPVDGSSLALFRILVGLLVLVWLPGDLMHVLEEVVRARIRFPVGGFGWVPVPGVVGAGLIYGALMLMAVAVVLGWRFRVASALLAAGFAYVFVLDQVRYSDHAWFLLLSLILLCLLPAHRTASLDARRTGGEGAVPLWAPVSVAVLTAVAVLYAGAVRVSDDWLKGFPLWIWFTQAAGDHFLGSSVAGILEARWTARAWSGFAVAAHLLVIPGLLWKRTRVEALSLLVLYYAGLSLGLGRVEFPFAIAAGLVAFFPPGAPRAFLDRVFRMPAPAPAAVVHSPTAAGDGAAIGSDISYLSPAGRGRAAGAGEGGLPALIAVCAVLAFHVLFPARAWFYPGPPGWSGDGMHFAWRDGTVDQYCKGEIFRFDPPASRYTEIRLDPYLTPAQRAAIVGNPAMMERFARYYIESSGTPEGPDQPRVFARFLCSYNSRPYRPFVHPQLDLSEQDSGWGPAEWVHPLHMLPPGWRVVGPGK